MNEEQRRKVKAGWMARFSDFLPPKASESQLQAFEAEHGPLPKDVRWFLAECGGGGLDPSIGGQSGIEALSRAHRKFKKEVAKGFWDLMRATFMLGWDGAGNAFGLEIPSGRVVLQDHNFGGLHEIAPSLYDYFVDQIERPCSDD